MSDSPAPRYMNKRSAPHITTLILLASMTALAMNIFLPSLPKIADHFDTPYHVVQLSVAIFLAVNGTLQLFIGPLADKYGRRPIILTGLAVFCVATLGCLFAPNVQTFLAFRMLQATVAAAMVLSRAVVRDMNTAETAASVMGYVTMGMSVVPMIAPALGGLLDQAFGWQSTFWALFLCGVAVFCITWLDLGETGTKSDLSLGAQFREYPDLLTSPRFWGYCLASALASGSFFAFLGGAPYVASSIYGMTPAQFGYFTGAPAVGYFLGNWITGAAAARIGMNRMVLIGTAVIWGGLGTAIALTATGLGGPLVFFGFMAFVGLGNGMTIPSATAGMLSVRPHLAGTASGLGGAIMIGGGAILSALAGVLLGPGRSEMPLLVIMFLTGLGGFVAILMVIRRERRIFGSGG
ncbi:multidrug effflux MFS transporter [Pseudooceanicola sp. C21-150M6]|uniref:multidrug effflux MFS transporter n=1 Tax=Pseudooceanicola sp. C21-150M6 TaxID=3434355 RepID=UPI003D7FF3F3